MNSSHSSRSLLALTASAALAIAAGSAQAEVALLGGELFASGAVRAEYDSNIYANSTEIDDVLFRLTPGVAWVRDAGLIRAEATGGVEFQQFCDNNEENSDNPFGTLDLTWAREGGKSDGRFSAALRRLSYANAFVNERTRVDNLSVGGAVGHFVTEKLGYRVKADYLDQDYLTSGYSAVRKVSAGAEGRYQYSPKLEALVGYTFRDSTTRHRSGRASINSTDHRFLAGFDGELLPKVTGRLAAGVVTRNFSASNLASETGLLLETGLDWAPDDDTTVAFFARRDFDTSPVDQTVRSLELGFDVARKLSEKLTLSAGLSYEHGAYVGGAMGRTDDVFAMRARADYRITELIGAALDVSYRDTDSTMAISDCAKTVVGASIAARF